MRTHLWFAFLLIAGSGTVVFFHAAAQESSLVKITRVSTGRSYQLTTAQPGVAVYTDRRYKLKQLPAALRGHILLQTANEDDSTSARKHLQLYLKKPATLYICYDRRADRPASWLKGWQLTNAMVIAEDPTCRVFRRAFPAGNVTLGGNERGTTGAPGNYFVLIVPGNQPVPGIKIVKVVTDKDITAPRPAKPPRVVDSGKVMPRVPDGFHVTLFAREPLIRNPAAMCFDAKGRLCVGQGPQFRSPKPDTLGDSIKILIDEDGDGIADKAKTFAEGFNCIQGLAWKGNDLWVANSPDLTVVRDLDGDDEADEYIRVYTDLGNLEHALHGLNWGPDGKLYMSKGNSRGYNRPGHVAPKAFRDLYGVVGPKNAVDFPKPKVFKKGEYKRAYHHPADHWGRDGGVLRCDDMGKNLEIVSRGFRNPWDITFDDGFNLLGTDNDQDEGDRVFMPFYGAHFGWGHSWSYHWTGHNHPPTVPLSAPVFHGSGTGIIYYAHRHFPLSHRHVFFINDWGRGKTYLYRPRWDGALMQEQTDTLHEFSVTNGGLYRPTDIVVGPDGTLYIGGWGSGYGVRWSTVNGKKVQTNEGRIFRIRYGKPTPSRKSWDLPHRRRDYAKWTPAELLADLAADVLPVWRINAADEFVRRGSNVQKLLMKRLTSKNLSKGQQTWLAWTLGRIAPQDVAIDRFFADLLPKKAKTPLNLRIQALRILAYRIRNHARDRHLPDAVRAMLRDPEPRHRFEAVQAIWQAGQKQWLKSLKEVAARETDRLTFYSAWHALAELTDLKQRKAMLHHKHPRLRFAALLGLLETRSLKLDDVWKIAEADTNPQVQEWALHYALNALPSGPVSNRENWSRFRYQFFDRIITKLEQTKNPRIQSALAQLVSRVEYQSKQWQRLRDVYRRLQKSKDVPVTDLAHLLRALAKDERALPLLWEALPAKQPLSAAARLGLEQFRDANRVQQFLLQKLPAAEPPQQRLGITTLARVEATNTWPPQPPVLDVLTTHFRKTVDPRLKRDTLSVIQRLDFRQLAKNKTQHKQVLDIVRHAATEADPRVHSLVAPLANKLDVTIPVTAKRTPATIATVRPLLKNANPKRGADLFFDARRGNCASCHRVGGRGASFAPPLSDIGSRAKVEEILEAILQPSAKITEGYHVSVIVTNNGKTFTGVVRKETATTIEVFQADGRSMELVKKDIDQRYRGKQSIMPGNLGELLAKEEIADLTAWLLLQKSPNGRNQAQLGE